MAPCGSYRYRLATAYFLYLFIIMYNKGLSLDLQGKPTDQSTTIQAAVGTGAGRAVDGNVNTITHTQCNGDQWWRVDLLAIYCLTKITIVNRNDHLGIRLQGAVVRAGLNLDHSQNQMIGTPVTRSQANSDDKVISFISNASVAAQYVSVDLTGDCLTLAEVRVEAIMDTEATDTATEAIPDLDFTLIAIPAVLGQTGDDDAAFLAYKGPNDITAAVSFGRQLTTGGIDGLPQGSVGKYDPFLGCPVRILTLPETGGIQRTGVFYSEAFKNGKKTKIQSVILHKDDNTVHVRPLQRTQTASIRDSVTLEMQNVNAPNNDYRWRQNGGDFKVSWNGQLTVSIMNVTLAGEGVYSCHVSGKEDQQLHGFMRLIVRGCPTGTWGPASCLNICRRCYNGGICHDKSGTCICAPGFSGESCEQVHGRHVFGQSGSHSCSDSTDPHNEACRGRLFCLPDPYGCSCVAGYTGLDCMQECNEGMYGADCKQTCHCESGGICLKDTGECGGNCVAPYSGTNCQCSFQNVVLGLRVISEESEQLRVSWQPDPCVSGYTLQYELTNGGQCEEIVSPQRSSPESLSGQTTNYLIIGLESRSTYMVYLRPQYNGIEAPEVLSSGTTLRRNNPTSVTPLTVTSYDSVSATLSWRLVFCAERYTVQYALINRGGCEAINSVTYSQHCMCQGTTFTTTIPGLLPNSWYNIQVKAYVDGGYGPTEEVDVITSTSEPTEPPDTVSFTPAKRNLSFSWSPPPCGGRGGYITGYTYMFSKEGSQPISTVTADQSVTIGDLIPYTNYIFRVSANTSVGVGPYSDVITARTLEAEPTVPLNVTILNVDDVSITVTWSEPNPPQGIITHYNVRYWRSGQTNTTTDASGTQLEHRIMNLQTNVTYFLEVQAETYVGAGPWSDAVNATTMIGVPGPVRNLRSTKRTETSITLDWEPPLKPAAQVISYIVEYRIFTSMDKYSNIEIDSPPFTKDDLDPATRYEFKVRAKNEKFAGDPSILTAYTKPQTNPPQPTKPKSYPDEATDTSVTIGLTKPTSGDQFVDSYVVQVKITSSMAKRAVLIPSRYEDSSGNYIAAEFPKESAPNKFVVGDAKMYGGYYNAPLQTGADYEIRVGSVSRGNEMMAYVTYSEPLTVTDVRKVSQPTSTGVIVAVVVVLIVISTSLVVAFVVYRRRTKQGKETGVDAMLNSTKIELQQKAAASESYCNHNIDDDAEDRVRIPPNTPKPKPVPRARPKQTETRPAAKDEERKPFKLQPPVRQGKPAEYIKTKELAGDDGFLADYEVLSANPKHKVYKRDSRTRVDLDKDVYEAIALLPTWASKLEIKWENLVIDDVILGKGNFGEVRAGGVMKTNGEITKAAVKTLKETAPETDAEDFMKEVQTMARIQPHPNVVRLLGACFYDAILYVALEYLPNGNLRDYLRSTRPKQRQAAGANAGESTLTSSNLLTFGADVARGMDHLSNTGIIHRDLAARNILLAEDLTAKVSDFGLSRGEDVYVQKSSTRIPTRWLAIESLMRRVYKSKSDVWSFGILLWEIATYGATPYPGIESKSLAHSLLDGYRMPKPENCADEIYDLMLKCWREKPSRRPNFREICEALEKMISKPDENIYLSTTIYENFIIKREFDDI